MNATKKSNGSNDGSNTIHTTRIGPSNDSNDDISGNNVWIGEQKMSMEAFWQAQAAAAEAKYDDLINKKTNFQMVKQFHKAFNDKNDPDKPLNLYSPLSQKETDMLHLRMRLIQEEYDEVMYEFNSILFGTIVTNRENVARLCKELADLLYVVYGTAASLGVDLDDVFEEVHNSNMSKLGEDGKPVYREDGKVLKGPNYKKANVMKVIYGSEEII